MVERRVYFVSMAIGYIVLVLYVGLASSEIFADGEHLNRSQLLVK